MKPRVVLLRPEEDAYSPLDQSTGARLAWRRGTWADLIQIEEDVFDPAAREGLGDKARSWAGSVAGIVGATNVPQSTSLGEIAEELNLLCFVANNNPSVWQHRRSIFHIGLPTTQTAEAVAGLLARAGFGRVSLLHDQTEFQSRVATSMKAALEKRNMRVGLETGEDAGWMERIAETHADLVYLIYSTERRARPLAMACRNALPKTSLLFGRSLLRQSFIESLGTAVEGAFFVDLFRRGASAGAPSKAFETALSEEAVKVATANHGFGWDAMTLCALALTAAGGHVTDAIDYLESGVSLEGVTGLFRFNKENHNGREGFGPTRISRWYNGRLEEAYAA
jgi:ABC-type branched-subunit amino acid transport system substrate-binding protein